MPVTRRLIMDRGTSAECEQDVIEAFQDTDERGCGSIPRPVLNALVPLLPGTRLTQGEETTFMKVLDSMVCPSSGRVEYGKFISWVFAPPRRSLVSSGIDFEDLVAGRGRKIPQIHRRSVTIEDLRRLQSFLQRMHDPVSGKLVCLATLNTYHIDALVLEPLAAKNSCSYAESVAPVFGQDFEAPHWFVSHIWADSFTGFMRCLEEHSAARGTEYRYWACEFARCHGMPGEDLNLGLRHAYFKSIWSAVGVFTVLESSPPAAHQRVWCFMEQGAVDKEDVRKQPLQLDVARPASESKVELVLGDASIAEESVPWDILKRSVTSSCNQLAQVQDSQRTTVLKHFLSRPEAYLDDFQPRRERNGFTEKNGNNRLHSVRTIYGVVVWRKRREAPKPSKSSATRV